MTMKALMGALLLVFVSFGASAQGIEFFDGTYEQALEKAKKENKIVFVDFYADWCGPCKYLSSKVFPDPGLGEYFNSRIVPVKVDIEAAGNRAVVDKFKIESLPTLAFVDSKGALLSFTVGSMSVEDLMKLARRATKDDPGFEDLYSRYRADKNDVANVRELLKEAPSYVTTLSEGIERDKWIVRIERIFKEYINSNLGPQIINADDYKIIKAFHQQPAAGDKIVEFINTNMQAYLDKVGQGPAYYVIEYNDRIMSDLARSGKAEYKKYMERVTGDMKTAYDAVAQPPLTPEERYHYIMDSEYALFGKKDAATYVALLDEYFTKSGDNITTMEYGEAAQKIYTATGGKVPDKVNSKAKEWMVKALQDNSVNLLDRLNLVVLLGDINRTLNNTGEARKCYNQAFMEAMQLSDDMTKAMVQMKVKQKLDALELLKK